MLAIGFGADMALEKQKAGSEEPARRALPPA
jgi:hypothetical protein